MQHYKKQSLTQIPNDIDPRGKDIARSLHIIEPTNPYIDESCVIKSERNDKIETTSQADLKTQQLLEDILVSEYKSRQFIVWGPIYRQICVFFLLVNLGAAIAIEKARFSASICVIAYAAFLIIRVYADKLIEEKQYDGRVFFGRAFLFVFTLTHAVRMTNDDLQDNQTYAVGGLALLLNFMLFFYLRVSSTPDFYRHACIGIASICFIIAPPCDLFGRYYEPLLFLCIMVAGEAFGITIDAPHLTIFVLTQVGNITKIEEEKDRVAAAEAIISYQDLAMQERIRREKVEKHADSMLNHNLKNIMADGIASVELYELTLNEKHLMNAKLSMKRGMSWTRRRQSLIMLCDGTYQLQSQKTTIQNLVCNCICGRNIESDLSTFPSDLLVELDPMLIGLALENGLSNALKHSSDRPRIICQLSENNNITSCSALLQLIIQNKAVSGAPFIDKAREKKLFQCGIHSKGTVASSDGIGLGHAVMAATALGGKVSLRQSEDIISYTITLEVKIHHNTAPKSKSIMNERTLTTHKIQSSSLTRKNAKRGMLIDDSKVARKFADQIMMPQILGMQNWIVLGESLEQVELSIPMALAMNIDIVIIDENLEYESVEKSQPNNMSTVSTILKSGSIVCASMKKKGVNALFCIRSGNTSPNDIDKYIKAGAHCIICKSFNNQELAKPLHDGFCALQEESIQRASGTYDPQTSVFPILLID